MSNLTTMLSNLGYRQGAKGQWYKTSGLVYFGYLPKLKLWGCWYRAAEGNPHDVICYSVSHLGDSAEVADVVQLEAGAPSISEGPGVTDIRSVHLNTTADVKAQFEASLDAKDFDGARRHLAVLQANLGPHDDIVLGCDWELRDRILHPEP